MHLKSTASQSVAPPPLTLAEAPYDRRRLSYASTFTNPSQRVTIQTIEHLTGKLRLLRKIRRFETMGVPHGQAFWKQALDVMGIELKTPQEQIDRIPKDGPLIITSGISFRCHLSEWLKPFWSSGTMTLYSIKSTPIILTNQVR